MELEIGKTYKITHRKKGEFVGQLLDKVPLPPEDVDPYFLRMKVDTRKGTSQHRLAWTDVDFREIDIRPSHVLECEEVEPDQWLLKQTIQPTQNPMEQYRKELELTVKTVLAQAERQQKQQQKPSLVQRFIKKLGGSHE